MLDARFVDRRDAGRQLAERLATYAQRDDVTVLGLPRGGLPVADEVARAVGAPLDVFLVRKLGVPVHPELAMGAIALHLPAHADAGHDHGDEAPAAAGRALPRFTAESENFELVGVLDGRRLTLYLDRFADNSPVKDARLELQLGDEKLVPEAHGEGSFEAMLAHVPAAGVLPVTATVSAGRESDLLAGDFDLHDAHVDAGAVPQGARR